MDTALGIGNNKMLSSISFKQSRDSESCCTCSSDNNLERSKFFFGNLQSIDQSSKNNDSRSMLIIMKNRDIEPFFELFFNIKAVRSSNIFQINPSKTRSNTLYGRNNFIRILSVQHEGNRIYITKSLEQHSFPLHHWQSCKSSDISKSQNSTSITHHSNTSAFPSVIISFFWIFCDL